MKAKNDPAPPGKRTESGKTASTVHLKKPVEKKEAASEKKPVAEVKKVG